MGEHFPELFSSVTVSNREPNGNKFSDIPKSPSPSGPLVLAILP
jgi:hypothetical protein